MRNNETPAVEQQSMIPVEDLICANQAAVDEYMAARPANPTPRSILPVTLYGPLAGLNHTIDLNASSEHIDMEPFRRELSARIDHLRVMKIAAGRHRKPKA